MGILLGLAIVVALLGAFLILVGLVSGDDHGAGNLVAVGLVMVVIGGGAAWLVGTFGFR